MFSARDGGSEKSENCFQGGTFGEICLQKRQIFADEILSVPPGK